MIGVALIAAAAAAAAGFGPSSSNARALNAARRPAILLTGKSSGATLRPGTIDGAYRAVGPPGKLPVSDVTIDGLQAHVIRDCIRINGTRIIIRNVHCWMLPPPQRTMHELPEGLHIKSGDHIRIEDSSFEDFQMSLDAAVYWNGDGVAVERGVSDISFRNVSANNNSDAGFDIKSPVSMDGVSASGNCRNFRFWSDADIGTIRIGDVTRRGGSSACAGIWVGGSPGQTGPSIRIRNLIVNASKPLKIVAVQKGNASIRIDRCTIRAPRGSELLKMQKGLGSAELGTGCKVL